MRDYRPTLIALTLGGDEVASSRVRISGPLRCLQQRGIVTHRVTAKSRGWPAALLFKALTLKPSVTIIQKIALPSWFARIIIRLSRKVIFECDDAIYMDFYSGGSESAKTRARLKAMLPHCDAVIVSNALLREDFIRLGADASRIEVFPGPAPEVIENRKQNDRAGVLWLGSPSTFGKVEELIYPAMRMLSSDLTLTAIGCERDRDNGRIRERKWTMERQRTALTECRVGVAPQGDDEWSRRKAFYKVLEYLSASVIPIVPNQDAIRVLLGDEFDLLAVMVATETPIAWAAAIERGIMRVIDDRWISARDRVFENWSADRLGQVMMR